MTVLILPHFYSLSEFIAGLNGDCGPLATLSALNEYDAAKWPLTAEALKLLDESEFNHGFTEANGAQNIPSMAGYLANAAVPHTVVGYAEFTWDKFHADLKANAGHNPIIIEWSKAGALPGDEPNVQFHFSTCGGINTGPKNDGVGGGYLFCDGDNRSDDQTGRQTSPVFYTIQNIEAAAPIAYVIVPLPEPKPAPAPTPAPAPAPAPDPYETKYNNLKAAFQAALEAN